MSRPLVHLLCILCLLLAAPQVRARRVAAVDPRTQAMTLRDGADELQKRGQRAAAIQKARSRPVDLAWHVRSRRSRHAERDLSAGRFL